MNCGSYGSKSSGPYTQYNGQTSDCSGSSYGNKSISFGPGHCGSSSSGYRNGSNPCRGPSMTMGQGMEPSKPRVPNCGPNPCYKQFCPQTQLKCPPKLNDLKEPNIQQNATPSAERTPPAKGFGIGMPSWSLCMALIVFCCGVYLTKKMSIVANELG